VKEAGYSLPPGYAMLQGTSMASPQAAGAAALLLSAARQHGLTVTPAQLRTALTSTARDIPGFSTVEQGAGLVAVGPAWDLLRRGVAADTYTVKAPVNTVLSPLLQTPGYGTGVYDREGGLTTGAQRTYAVTVTRTGGPAADQWHTLTWARNDGTFRIEGSPLIRLPLGQPVTVRFCWTVSDGRRLNDWMTKPILLRRSRVRRFSLSPVIAVPPSRTSPAVGLSRPAAHCRKVLLPLPDGPITAVKLPRGRARSTPRSACTAASPRP
jgi:subtilase family protein